jgi:DNA recombination protein RmuC
LSFDVAFPAAATLALAIAAIALLAVLRQGASLERLRLLGEQAIAAQRGETGTLRAALADTERALAGQSFAAAGQLRVEIGQSLADLRATLDGRLAELREANDQRLSDIQQTLHQQLQQAGEGQTAAAAQLRLEVTTAIADLRTALDARLRELREGNEAKLEAIQKTVNEQLHEAVEKQMTTSFQRVTEQFAQVQKAMGDVQAVTAQIGDLKRLFGNVKTRGGWGETQVRAMLDDILPVGAYETNWKPRPNAGETVEFAVVMPGRGGEKVHLPVDAKFPVEDYERLLLALDGGDAEGERTARRALERRVRDEARKIAEKYIVPPTTVEFAVMYLPTDGLYAEIARIPGLIDDIGRQNRVLVMGPTLFPALLRTIHLGYITMTLEQKATEIGQLLSATRAEMGKMDKVLETLGNQVNTVSRTIESAKTRTRAVDRKLRSVEAADPIAAERLLGLDAGAADDEQETA